MQHVWRFAVVKKLADNAPDGAEPEVLERNYVTESSRRSKVHKLIVKDLEKVFDIKKSDIENIYLLQLR